MIPRIGLSFGVSSNGYMETHFVMKATKLATRQVEEVEKVCTIKA